MSTRLLICGSIAFDSIMIFPGQFQDHIVKEHLSTLNLTFEVEQLRREFGGCAGNIAYSFQALGSKSVVMGTVGKDGQIYIDRLNSWGCDTTHVRILHDAYTPQAFITTDRNNNQMTAFHPGAMNECHLNHIYDAPKDIALAIVAPEGYKGMQQHVRECWGAHIPCLFDPGQGLPLFTETALTETIASCTWLIVNEYELTLLEKILKKPLTRIVQYVEAIIVTRGDQGSDIHLKHGEVLSIPAVPADRVLDPTGCGDAYRAGLIYGLLHGWSWLKSGRLASLLGAIAIGSHGAQNHLLNRTELEYRYMHFFQETLWE